MNERVNHQATAPDVVTVITTTTSASSPHRPRQSLRSASASLRQRISNNGVSACRRFISTAVSSVMKCTDGLRCSSANSTSPRQYASTASTRSAVSSMRRSPSVATLPADAACDGSPSPLYHHVVLSPLNPPGPEMDDDYYSFVQEPDSDDCVGLPIELAFPPAASS